MKQFVKIFLYSSIILLLLSSCVDEDFTSSPSARLEYSVDTLKFDTLFSKQPSRTLKFMIYNHNDQAITLSKIYLESQSNSIYRFNVDGSQPNENNQLYNMNIKANDSLFVFVELTPREVDVKYPIEMNEHFLLEYNTNTDKVVLSAFSQKIIAINDYVCGTDEHFTKEFPYLVKGNLIVPKGVKLTVESGTKLYMHGGSNFVVDGEVEFLGSYEEPILISGDRLDAVNDASQTPYSRLTNQWGSLYFRNSQGHSIMNYVEMRGSNLGILLLGTARYQPILDIKSCKIHTSEGFGVFSQNGNLNISNSLIYNCVRSGVSQLGGRLSMKQVTLANYLPYSSSGEPALTIMNYTVSNGRNILFPIKSTTIYNSIVMGKGDSQVLLGRLEDQPVDFNVYFSHSLLQMKQSDQHYFSNCIWTKNINGLGLDSEFMSTRYNRLEKQDYDFHLSEEALSRNAGSLIIGNTILKDLDNIDRTNDGQIDIGCYEYQKNK